MTWECLVPAGNVLLLDISVYHTRMCRICNKIKKIQAGRHECAHFYVMVGQSKKTVSVIHENGRKHPHPWLFWQTQPTFVYIIIL